MLDLSKLEAYADEKSKVAKIMKLVLGNMLENFVNKRKNARKCWLPAFSPLPTMFSKALFCRVLKTWDCVVKS